MTTYLKTSETNCYVALARDVDCERWRPARTWLQRSRPAA